MDEARLKLNQNSITHKNYTDNEVIYGNFYFELNNQCYPDESWDDYIYRALLTWTYNLIHYGSGCLYFMDGPYEVHYNINRDKIIFYIEEFGEFKCPLDTFANDLASCLEVLQEYMKEQKLDKNNITNLSTLLCQLKGKYLL